MKLIIVISFLILLYYASPLYKRVIHNYDPEAKCIDGSPGLLYVHEGGDTKNMLIFIQGGGLCGEETLAKTLQSCYQRSKTLLGSSKYWPQEFQGEGYLSTDPTISRFANWTKFIFGYCDGALHQGYSSSPVKYKDIEMYFRGGAITRSHFNWINSKWPMNKLQKLVLTGGSAGGIAVHLWNNYLHNLVKNQNIIYSIDDSGVFLNTKTTLGDNKIQKQISNIFKVANVNQTTPFSECNLLNRGQEWKCLFFQNGLTLLKGKYLIINSEYDSWSIPNILQIHCLKQSITKLGQTLSNCSKTQLTHIQKYRSTYRQIMTKFMVVNSQASIWSIACSNHVYACLNAFYNSQLNKVPFSTGNTVKNAIEQFVFGNEKIINYDVEAWPANIGCAK